MKSFENSLRKRREIKIDIGCGIRKSGHEYIGIDKVNLPGVDIVLDLENGLLPFSTNSVDEVVAFHILEHIHNYIPLLEEIWRILKPGASLMVKVPNYKHSSAYSDPTHIRFFTTQSFNFFDKTKVLFKESGWYLSHIRFTIIDRIENTREITFHLKTQKHNILFISPPTSIHTLRWYNSLVNYGYNIDIAARKMKGIANFGIGTSDDNDRFKKFEGMSNNLIELLKKKSYDVIHAHFGTCYGHLLNNDFANKVKKVLSVWGEDVLEDSFKNKKLRYRLLQGLSSTNIITVTSQHMKDTLVEKFNIPINNIWLIPWGYSNIFYNKIVNRKVYDNYKLSPEIPIITSGRVCRPQNNIENIVDAFLNSNIRAQLVILTGELSDPNYVKHLKNKTFKDSRIKFLNTLKEKELVNIYNMSEAIISIPYFDQLSTTIIESLVCGTPVICSDIPVYHERIVSKKNGLFINPDDKKELINAIKYFTDKSKKNVMSSYAIDSVKEDSWEKNVKKLMILYDAPE